MARHDIRGTSPKDIYNINDNFIQLSKEIYGNSDFTSKVDKQVKKNTESLVAITTTVGDLDNEFAQFVIDFDNIALEVADKVGSAEFNLLAGEVNSKVTATYVDNAINTINQRGLNLVSNLAANWTQIDANTIKTTGFYGIPSGESLTFHSGTGFQCNIQIEFYSESDTLLSTASWHTLKGIGLADTISAVTNAKKIKVTLERSTGLLLSDLESILLKIEAGTVATAFSSYPPDEGIDLSEVYARIESAEEKITPTAIKGTVESQITANGSTVLATKTDVTQTSDALTIEISKKGSELINQEYMRTASVGSPLSNSGIVSASGLGRNDNINRISIVGTEFAVGQYIPHIAKSVYRLSIKDAYREHSTSTAPLLIGLEFWDDMGVSTIANNGTVYIAAITPKYQWVGEKGATIDTSLLGDEYHRCKYVRVRVLTFWNDGLTTGAYTYIEGLSLRREGQVSSIYGTTYSFDSVGFAVKDSNGSALMTPNGVANEQNIGRADNVEDGYPMRIPFNIGTEVSQITQAKLKWDITPFRTYSKGAAAGGGTITTPSGGGSTSGGGGSVVSTIGVHDWTQGLAASTSNATVTSSNLGQPHYHTTATSNLAHRHRISLADHYHSTPNHVHTFDTSHQHPPVFGILTTSVTSNWFAIYIDGVYRTSVDASRGEVDLSAWITTNGWHTIDLMVTSLKRIDASLFLKTYIRR